MHEQQLTPKPFLSFCAIVKNEAENLPRCLASVRPYVDEIIIVDTGSQDNTVQIATEYGAKVSYFQWCDDFAKARNYAISQVSGEWILMLDADHELVVKSNNFKEIVKNEQETIAYYIDWTDAYETGLSAILQPLLFRNIPELRYKYPFHEYLTYKGESIPVERCKHLEDLQVIHYGFGDQQLLQKANERIQLLEKLVEKDFNLMLMLTLHGLYKATEQTDKIEKCNQQVMEYLLPYLITGQKPEPFRAVTYWLFLLGCEFFSQKDYETTILLCQNGIKWCYNYPPLYYLSGEILLELGFTLGAIPYFQTCLNLGKEGNYNKSEPFDLDLTKAYPAERLGFAYTELQYWQNAKEYFQLSLSFKPNYELAQKGLEEVEKHLNYDVFDKIR